MSSIEEISFKEIFLNDENNEFYIEILNITKKLINHNEAEDIIHDVIISGIAKDIKITIRENKLQDSVIKYLTTSILNKTKIIFEKKNLKNYSIKILMNFMTAIHLTIKPVFTIILKKK